MGLPQSGQDSVRAVRLNCSATIARRLLMNVGDPWGWRHAILVVATEANTFAAWWPRIYDHAPTPECGEYRCRKGA